MHPQIIVSKPDVKQLSIIATKLDELNKVWTPHAKQVEFVASVLFKGVTQAVLEWGRRTGKSEGMVVAAALWGQFVTGSQSHYFAPQAVQAKDIIIRPQKVQNCIPANWIEDHLDGDMIFYWANGKSRGTWFKMNGADDYDRKRGIEPRKGILFVDEVREVPREFWSNVMEPTLARWNSPVVFSSTPPDSLMDAEDPVRAHWVIDLFDRIKARMEAKQPALYSHATSYDNPHLSKEWLDKTKQELIDKGEEDIWLREYMAQRVPKKQGRTYPMLSSAKHKKPHKELAAKVLDRPQDYEFYALADPGSRGGKQGKSVWSWNLFAVHLYTRKLLVLDEIDCENQMDMVTGAQWRMLKDKAEELNPDIDAWDLYYDDAETWFANEMIDQFDVVIQPAGKGKRSKYEGRSVIKHLMIHDMLEISDRCVKTWWELENHEGEKSRDHHEDLFRYLTIVANYSPNSNPEPKPEDLRQQQKRSVLTAGLVLDRESNSRTRTTRDWTQGII